MENNKKPKVTVLMPVYNGEKYLKEAIESILSQTFTDFEFLIINDGSTDGSVDIIESYDDERIRLVHNEKNIRLALSLNRGLELSRGEYIARMDCDDIALPERLEKQVSFMDKNPGVGMCGTWIKTIGEIEGDIWKYPTDYDTIKCSLLFVSTFAHPSIMIRKSVVDKYNVRYSKFLKSQKFNMTKEDIELFPLEDLELWRRLSFMCPVVNLDDVLVLYRITKTSSSWLDRESHAEIHRRMDGEVLADLGLMPSNDELKLHRQIAFYKFNKTQEFVSIAADWLVKLMKANELTGIYPKESFKFVLGEKWFTLCSMSTGFGFWSWKSYWASPLSRYYKLSFVKKLKFAVKCGIRYGK